MWIEDINLFFPQNSQKSAEKYFSNSLRLSAISTGKRVLSGGDKTNNRISAKYGSYFIAKIYSCEKCFYSRSLLSNIQEEEITAWNNFWETSSVQSMYHKSNSNQNNQEDINPDNNKINLPSTAKGTFFVKIIAQTEIVVKKIVVE